MSVLLVGIGLETLDKKGNVLAVRYTKVFTSTETNMVKVDDFINICRELGYEGGNQTIHLSGFNLNHVVYLFSEHGDTLSFLSTSAKAKDRIVITILETDEAITDTYEAYLKLIAPSKLIFKPNELNLDGMFGNLPNVACTSEGVISLDELEERMLIADVEGRFLKVFSIDKLPQMADYVVPKGGVRIANTDRVRLGAHLAPGTTVMHEGFCNFNAGTLGESMIEGRISAGVVIGSGSDLGGGCSTMGTLSGGGTERISVGERCLLGANSGLGISLGDDCIIEAGLYVTAGAKVLFDGSIVKALELSGKSGLLFIRNSTTGAIECRRNTKIVELNEDLHKTD